MRLTGGGHPRRIRPIEQILPKPSLLIATARLALALVALNSSYCFAADWRSSIDAKLTELASQLNDGCSTEVRDARKVYQFGSGENRVFAGLISVEGQHCGNGHIEYLAVYQLGYTEPKDERDVPITTYWLVGFAIIGGRGERMVDFETLKYRTGVFTMNAHAYHSDPMCCPSVPVELRYKLSFYGLTEMQSTTTSKRGSP
jgi:hypothetical protein